MATPPRKIAAALDSNTAAFRLHPDGHGIVYVVIGGGEIKLNQIWALENFLPAIQVSPSLDREMR